ncbi:hypothetical protein [Nocardia xishanensis]|uniref:Uncharacterized protein n=1 Tax=Nocardia xishanensis TaxID=238964 RepID=A0ABW7WYH2_9NOCA
MSSDERTAADLLLWLVKSPELDRALADYYARRVPDEREALWRTDYARARNRWDRFEDSPYPEHPRAIEFRAQARAIQAPWTADPEIAPRWAELDELRARFEHAVPFEENPPTMPSEAPPGMDPTTWRSHLQARDMTGHGRWSATTTTTTSDHEGAEPMTDTTAHHITESVTEQQMRHDFMQAQSFAARMRDPEQYDPADSLDYNEYASPWLDRRDGWAEHWMYLSDATIRWHEDPAAAKTALRAALDDELTPIQLRSELQARYIAEHGIERDESGLLTSHYVTRVADRESWADATEWANAADINAQAQVPVSSAFAAARTRQLAANHNTFAPASPLADYQPGNAVASALANSEREGAER